MDDTLHRVSDEIVRKHGDVRIGFLRAIYGNEFALGVHGLKTLGQAIDQLDPRSHDTLFRDYESGFLFGPSSS